MVSSEDRGGSIEVRVVSDGRWTAQVKGEMDGFVASFTNRLDQKGRISVPASFRAVLAQEGFDGIYAYPSLEQPAIDAGGARLKSAIDQRLGVFETFSDDYEVLSTAFYGDSRILKVDGDGRIVLPDEFREAAGIGDSAVFVGQGFKFQIWQPDRFAARRAEARSRLREVTRSLGRTRNGEGGS